MYGGSEKKIVRSERKAKAAFTNRSIWLTGQGPPETQPQ